MSKQARALLYYLRRYLEKFPEKKKKLAHLHKTMTGHPLTRSTLWRHLMLKQEPTLTLAMVYLAFLHHEKAITPGRPGNGLFLYGHPELLRK